MGTSRTNTRQLASEAGLDLDEALLRIWDVGLSYIADHNTSIRQGDLNRARRALGIPTRRDLTSPGYWSEALRLTNAEFEELLLQLGIARRSGSARLPKGAVAKLKAELRRRALPAIKDQPQIAPRTVPSKPFEFTQVGRQAHARTLSANDIVKIHVALVADFSNDADPIEPPGIRSQAMLDSAVFRPQTSLGDGLKYQTVEMAVAALFHALVHDHAFHNGNKRTAMVALLVALDENGFILTCAEDALFKFVLQVAQHRVADGPTRELADREVVEIARWVRENSRVLEKGERSLTFRKLKQILTRYGCNFTFPSGVGNRINIARNVEKRRWLLPGVRTSILRTQVAYRNDGTDVEKNTIAKIRGDLELDEQHGVDSSAFYEDASTSVGDFIVRYRKTLRRLARM